MGNEKGNVSVFMLGLTLFLLGCFTIVWLFTEAHMVHGSLNKTATAGAMAASTVLEESFISDISPEAFNKLENLTNRITKDELYEKGEVDRAIRKYTVPSQLRDELLQGKRGRQIELYVLLAYRPFYDEEELGNKIAYSFQKHAGHKILSTIKKYLHRNSPPDQPESTISTEIAFPVYNKIEIRVKKRFSHPLINRWIREKELSISGRGYFLAIKILDNHRISYKLPETSIFRKEFH